MKKIRSTALIVVAFLSVIPGKSLFADSFVVAPNANTSTNGGNQQFGLFGQGAPSNTIFQWDIAASQLTGVVGNSIDAIGFRLAFPASVTGPIDIGTWDLQLSPSLNPIGSLSATFANNIGKGATTVLSGALTLGTLTDSLNPDPFFLINFSTPYLYSGGDLLLTLNVLNSSSFAVDAISPGSVINTVGSFNGSSSGTVGLFNAPVTELEYTSAVAPIPEPDSLLLLGTGLTALIGISRRRLLS